MRLNNLSLIGALLLSGIWAEAALVFPTHSTWNYYLGTTEASLPDSTAWRGLGFDDSAWSSGGAPIGYGESDIVTGLPSSSAGNYSSVYFRKIFSIADLSEVSRLDLEITVDDGAVAWINGVEVGRINVPPGELAFNDYATSADERITLSISVTENLTNLLVSGNNVVAVHVFNGNLTSSDLLFDARMTTVEPDPIPPTITEIDPVPGYLTELTSVRVTFSEAVAGVEASDLWINSFPANSLSGGPIVYTFSFYQPPFGLIHFQWNPSHGIVDYAFPPNPFDETAVGATWEYNLVDDAPPTVASQAPPGGATVRSLSQIEVQFSEMVVGVDAQDLLINGQPATNLIALPGALYTFEFAQPAAGAVQVTWAPDNGIEDQAASPNPFPGQGWAYDLDPNAPAPDLVLNEIVASNQSGLLDETGEHPDWIEIWNRGTAPVNLLGWSLSDDESLQGKWVFPSRLLDPGEYIVVLASGKDIKNPAGNNRFHTNFKLGILGEHLGLYSPDSPRQPAPGVFGRFPEQRNDKSYGLDSAGQLRYFASPTPGAPNGDSSIVGVVAPVHFSVARGYFTEPFQVHLSTDTPGATIRYTTNGTEPTESNGRLCVGPLTIAETTLLRAAAFRPDSLPSLVGTHTYLFNFSEAFRSLPVVSIVTDSNHLYGRTGILGMNGGYGPPNDEWLPTNVNDTNQYHNPKASLTNGPAWERPTSLEFIRQDNSGFQIDCGIRVHGSGWTRPRYTSDDKFSFRLYFKGDYGPTRLEYPWFPESVDSSLDEVVLRAGHNDIRNPFIVDSLIRRLHFDMGQVASHGTFANLLVNGKPMVLRSETGNFYYNPVNRVKEGFLQAWHGGGLDWDIIAPFGDFQGGDRLSWNSLESFIRSQDISQQSRYLEVMSRLDLVNFVDYLLVNIYGATWDWPHNNWRAARERVPGGIWRFYVWDAEGAFYVAGRTPSYNNFTDSEQGLANTQEIGTFYRKLHANSEFRLLFADRIQKHFHNGGALTESNLIRRFNAMRTELAGVLPGMDLRIINDWVPNRRGILWTQFAQQELLAPIESPSFSRAGGPVARGYQLTMSAPSGTIYYTTNNQDPRVLFSGTPSPDAWTYTPGTPLVLDQSTVIKARARHGNDWSALTEATFTVGTLGIPLRITEIMYHPAGGNPAHEYIELRNLGAIPLDVSGLRLEGVTFTFPDPTLLAPGETVVLGSDADPAAFASRYPGVVVLGTFSGALANGGERIALLDRDGNIIQSVDYNDRGGWPEAADGAGYSLEIIDPLGAADEPANWQASLAVNGSPGQPNTARPVGVVRLNEIMAWNLSAHPHGDTFPDWIELHNTGPTEANLAGWSLTDNGDPRRFVFPAETAILPGQYLVVYCDAVTNTTPGLHTGFALDNDGETIQLYDANTNRLDALTFGLQLPDFSVGRIGQRWDLNLPTPQAANSAANLAEASQLTLNEWMANPPPGGDDWIELYNRSATLPAALQGLYLQVGDAVQKITALSFIAPTGYVQLRADENVGADHLDFKLPAIGGTIALYDSSAVLLEQVTYDSMTENASRGRYPDGSASVVNFTTSPSPGAPNFLLAYNGPVFHELMARNDSAVTNANGRTADWLELRNPNPWTVDLSGMSLSIDQIEPRQWIFPAGVSIPAGSYLVLWCDGSQPASTNLEPVLNTGRSLDGNSGGAYLFNASAQLVHWIEYGFQIENQSIGLSGSQWLLLSSATPGTANPSPAALGSPASLCINEWMADSPGEEDWFELYNPTDRPVALSGLHLTDAPTAAAATSFPVAPLSFIAPHGYVQWQASGKPGQGRNHVNFRLDAQGESVRLYDTGGSVIDSVYFGKQREGVSEGRLPDGADPVVAFETTPTPERSNYLPLPVVIQELLTHTDPPLEDAIELYNTAASEVNISGWYLSDSRRNFKKFRIPDNTTLAGHGYRVFYENQFNDGSSNAFALNSAHGGTLWLSETGPGNSLTGLRSRAEFSAAENGISFGLWKTPFSEDFVAQSGRSFGADHPVSVEEFRTGTGLTNPGPQVGPVVINEIMYHPPDRLLAGLPADNTRDEFLELHNLSTEPVALHHPDFSTNTWRLRGGVDFDFPDSVAIPAGGFVLVVGFDPVADPVSLAEFQTAYDLSAGVPIYGPFAGKLNNDRDRIRLLKPDAPQPPGAPDAGFVPFILADQVVYEDASPWPAGPVDGDGLSLQKPASSAYGNHPLHWVADQPTPGRANRTGVVPPPVIATSPTDASATPGSSVTFGVSATGSHPLRYQWRFRGRKLAEGTNATFRIPYVSLPDEGDYDVLVSNDGGTALSDAAHLLVTAPPVIAQGPIDQSVRGGTNVLLTVSAFGPGPLSYQWLLNGQAVPGATSPSLYLTNVDLADHGLYEIQVANPHATVSAFAFLEVLVNPEVLLLPQSQTVVEGDDVTLSIVCTGTLPMSYRWRRAFSTLKSETLSSWQSFLMITNIQLNQGGSANGYSVVLTNRAFYAPGVLSRPSAILTILPDSDGDRLPDQYETDHGLNPADPGDGTADSDNDGLTNREEYVAGTDPNNDASYLRVESLHLDGTGALIRFMAVAAKTYTLEYQDQLGGSPWQTLQDVPGQEASQEILIVDPEALDRSSRIYRLLTPKQD